MPRLEAKSPRIVKLCQLQLEWTEGNRTKGETTGVNVERNRQLLVRNSIKIVFPSQEIGASSPMLTSEMCRLMMKAFRGMSNQESQTACFIILKDLALPFFRNLIISRLKDDPDSSRLNGDWVKLQIK